MATVQLLREEGGFKLRNYEGNEEYIMDKWSSIRSNYDDNHLFFCTPDKKNIPFNREICCALSPFLFDLIQGTFEESCCRTNNDTYIILPDFSSKTVYDLAALMITGTIGELSAQCTKELKSLHSFLGFQSFIVKEENEDDITCSHEYRIEDDKMEEDHGDGGDKGEEEASKNDRSLGKDDTVVKMETGETEDDEANVMNDERMEAMTGEDVSIPSSSMEKDDDADMNDNDPSTPTVHGASPSPNTFSCASPLGWNEDSDGHNARNAHEELEEDESTTENNGESTPDFIGQDENPSSTSNKAKENVSVMDEDLIDRSEDNHEEEILAHTSSENGHVVKSSEITGDYKTLNCNVKLLKLKKLPNEDDDNEIRIKLGKKKIVDLNDSDFVHLKQKKSIKITPKRPVNIESESDVSYHVDITNSSKKRKSGKSKAAVSSSAMEGEEDFGEPELKRFSSKYGYNKSSGLYECGICDKKYKEKSSASSHMAFHQGRTTCEVCKKVLSRTSNLKLHMKMECEEKRYCYNKSSGLYECGICDKKYQHQGNARHHMAIHKGKTICEVCKKVLSRTTNLRLHMKTVHNKGAK